jgi:hypothetical protein
MAHKQAISEIRIHLPGLQQDHSEPDTYWLTGLEMVELDFGAIMKDMVGHGIPERMADDALGFIQTKMLAEAIAKKMTRV